MNINFWNIINGLVYFITGMKTKSTDTENFGAHVPIFPLHHREKKAHVKPDSLDSSGFHHLPAEARTALSGCGRQRTDFPPQTAWRFSNTQVRMGSGRVLLKRRSDTHSGSGEANLCISGRQRNAPFPPRRPPLPSLRSMTPTASKLRVSSAASLSSAQETLILSAPVSNSLD